MPAILPLWKARPVSVTPPVHHYGEMTPPTIRTPLGAPALDALAAEVGRLKAHDAMAAVTVVAPSVYAGLLLRRALARRAGGLVNVSFQPLARVADVLGAAALAAAARRPLSNAYAAAAVSAVLADDPRDLGAVARHPATVRALRSAFRELRGADRAVRDVLRAHGDRSRHVVDLLDAYEVRTQTFYDATDVLLAAAAAVRDGTAPQHALDEVGHVVRYLPRRTSAAERTFDDALTEAGRLTIVEGKIDPASITATHVVVAPDAEGELRAAAAEVVRRLDEGTRLDRLAVVHSGTEPYQRLAVEVLRAEGVPVAGPPVSTLSDTVAGRTIVALLEAASLDFPRTTTMAWLGGSPIVGPNGARVPLARWERASRDANVVGGASQWADRLHAAAALAAADGTRHRYDVGALDGLREFVVELASAVQLPTDDAGATSWAAVSAWLAGLLDRYLGDGWGRAARWPAGADDELEACRAVETAVRALATLDAIAPPPATVADVLAVVATQLDRPWGRAGAVGAGVFVGPMSLAVGADLDTVVVVGLAEGRVPPRRRDDPLLPDELRDVVGLETRRQRRTADHADFLAVVAGARRSVVTTARADERSQQRRLASPWLLAAAPHDRGGRLSADTLDGLDGLEGRVEWLTSFASFDDQVRRGAVPSAQGIALARLAAGAGADLGASFERGYTASLARASDDVTEWDGLVGPDRSAVRDDERVLSPTALERWAACPMRYFLAHTLAVKATTQPEDADRITAVDRGTLVHRVLERFMSEVVDRDWDAPWSDGERARLAAIAEDECSAAEANGLTGRALWWLLDKRAIHKHISKLLDVDAQQRAADGVRPVLMEFSFGLPGSEIGAVAVTTPSGRTRRFRGAADRLDATPDGSIAVVIDYKTGRSKQYDALKPGRDGTVADPVVAGTRLQLPVYALAAAARYPEATVKAAYWFVTDDAERYCRVPVELDERTDARFREVVGHIVDGIEDGVFPMNPGEVDWKTWQNCRFCEYDRVCPVDRGDAAERKQEHPAYVRLRSLLPAGATADE
jgi:CRISPR/Cas system-associated exonuclease Cas4 (RecB family)